MVLRGLKQVLFSFLSESSRKNIFLCLLVASILGTLSFLVLKASGREEEMLSEEEGHLLLPARLM